MPNRHPETLVIRHNRHGCLQTAYFVIAALGLGIGIAMAIRDGGADMSFGNHPASRRSRTWVPMPYTIPVALVLASPFFALPAWGVARERRAKITFNSIGIVETDSKGSEILRAKWDEVTEISRNRGTKIEVKTTRGVVRIDNRHRRFAEAMALLKEHCGKEPT
jgi:hypothetical protein